MERKQNDNVLRQKKKMTRPIFIALTSSQSQMKGGFNARFVGSGRIVVVQALMIMMRMQDLSAKFVLWTDLVFPTDFTDKTRIIINNYIAGPFCPQVGSILPTMVLIFNYYNNF